VSWKPAGRCQNWLQKLVQPGVGEISLTLETCHGEHFVAAAPGVGGCVVKQGRFADAGRSGDEHRSATLHGVGDSDVELSHLSVPTDQPRPFHFSLILPPQHVYNILST
jgi:hypothetical protein